MIYNRYNVSYTKVVLVLLSELVGTADYPSFIGSSARQADKHNGAPSAAFHF